MLYRLSYVSRFCGRYLPSYFNGAGDGNRTRASSLEGYSSTIELLPRRMKPFLTTGLERTALEAPAAGKATGCSVFSRQLPVNGKMVEGGGFEPPKA